ncbi:type I-C CRISPR-associated protein Cas8c/Csd1 [Marinobacter sp. LQ44]|nr:type I-C CRISPR-associated protein Cas8c/Csd1 [Marinobacter sp. LQ44]
MSWMAKLYETYEKGMEFAESEGSALMPISHTLQNAHINIVLDGNGHFKRAGVLEKTQIVLPATERSAGRASGEAPHPLADKVHYVAADYPKYGGKKKAYFEGYLRQLQDWCDSEWSHPKVRAVLNYVKGRRVVEDLVESGICQLDDQGAYLLTKWALQDDSPPLLFKVLPKEQGTTEQGNALVCWSVETEGDPVPQTWLDTSVQESWIHYNAQSAGSPALCYVTGGYEPRASNHPAKLRHTGDKAKLISANDHSGFTFRGRFLNSSQAAGVSLEVTQKAHSALRWLISRQGHRNGDQVMVAWAVSGRELPDLFAATHEFDLNDYSTVDNSEDQNATLLRDLTKDLGQRFAHSLHLYMAGYRARLEPMESVVIMALDSATPGRMAITYYRDFIAEEYLEKVELWHQELAWPQRVSKEMKAGSGRKRTEVIWPVSAPSPWAILNAAYGDVIKSNEALKKNLYERLLPSIIEGRPIPRDLVDLTVRRASNPNGSEKWEWERNLGVACALYRGFHARHPSNSIRREYAMALDTEYDSRDYLYGRLLAVGERIEEMAMFLASESARSTQASRLMQRFADRPASTWLTIEKALTPYQQRLRTKSPALEGAYKTLLDSIFSSFRSPDDFSSDKRLSGEFLLGFHCQRKWLRDHKLSGGHWISKAEAETENTINEGIEQ